ncbi:hypothetical protein CLAIMM_06900 isoform 2 [Cladophialophora immunda]|nr:hypothetical protein CLAIMM_06900 isoform 2 [Cladophialophora immunda]
MVWIRRCSRLVYWPGFTWSGAIIVQCENASADGLGKDILIRAGIAMYYRRSLLEQSQEIDQTDLPAGCLARKWTLYRWGSCALFLRIAPLCDLARTREQKFGTNEVMRR